jgi:hypothetical protein
MSSEMHAEHAGDHGRGALGGELQQGRRPGGAGVDAEGAEPFGEPAGAGGPAGLSAGEQPR